MARQNSARTGGARSNLYANITNKIISELEDGRLPWVQPWGTAAAKAPLAMPRNAATARQYSGINVLILWGSVIEHGFPVQGWLTFRQRKTGGEVSIPFNRTLPDFALGTQSDLDLLKSAIAHAPRHMTWLVTTHGKPRSEKAFSSWFADERRHADALADTLYSMDGLQSIDCEMRDNAVQQHRARRQG